MVEKLAKILDQKEQGRTSRDKWRKEAARVEM